MRHVVVFSLLYLCFLCNVTNCCPTLSKSPIFWVLFLFLRIEWLSCLSLPICQTYVLLTKLPLMKASLALMFKPIQTCLYMLQVL